MPRPVGAMERSLDTLAGGVLERHSRYAANLHAGSAQEIEEQVRVSLAGVAENGWGFSDRWVGFAWPFIFAPGQRGANPFRTPHFSYGIDVREGTAVLIVVHAHVIQWKYDNSSRVVGALVRFASSAPMLEEGQETSFKAVAHLTFQGYAAETEEGEVA